MSTDQQPSDAELISAVRGGDTTAYGELFSRHVEAARRLARQLTSAGDVEDLVSEAFAKVLNIVQRGGGPDLAFRAYLLTAVRSLHIDSVRGAARLRPVDDFTPFDDGVPFRDTAVEGFENQAAARAFATLPERWQLVLWHTEVEGQKPADVAKLLGMSANSVSALAYRAREGLRQAFLNMHAQDAEDDACAWTQDNLGAYIRNAASKRDQVKVRGHIDECRRCMGIYLELAEVNTNLSGILGPLVLGSAAAGYVATAVGSAASQGGLIHFVSAHATAVALVGVAAVIALIAGLVIGLGGPAGQAPITADRGLVGPPPTSFPGVPHGPSLSLSDPDPTHGAPEPKAPDDPAAPTGTTEVPESLASGTPDDTSTPDQREEHVEPDSDAVTPPDAPPVVEPAAPVDLTVTKRMESQAPGGVTVVTLAVEGLPEAGGLVDITEVGDEVRFNGECHGARTCTIPQDRELLAFMIIGSEVTQPTTVNFTVTPLGTRDPHLGDNTESVVLDPVP